MKKIKFAILVILLVTLTACGPVSPEDCIHEYGEWVITKESTCVVSGSRERTCPICNYVQKEELSKKSHTIVKDARVEPTCTKEGKTEGTHCKICKKVIKSQSSIPAAHDVDNGVVTKKATCSTTGVIKYTCRRCGAWETYELPKTDHTPNSNNICTVCGAVSLKMTEEEKNNANKVEYISNRFVDYLEDKNVHRFIFSFLDKNRKEISAPTLVELKITNSNGKVVYSKTIAVKTSDFKYYSQYGKEYYAAIVDIPVSSIQSGDSDSGTLSYRVYSDYASFDTYTLNITEGLPIKGPDVKYNFTLPLQVTDYTYSGKIDTRVLINNVEVSYDAKYERLTIKLKGEKTYDREGNLYNQYCFIGYKLIDNDGYVIKSGTIGTTSIHVGDKFVEEIYISNVLPGESYTFEISDVD